MRQAVGMNVAICSKKTKGKAPNTRRPNVHASFDSSKMPTTTILVFVKSVRSLRLRKKEKRKNTMSAKEPLMRRRMK